MQPVSEHHALEAAPKLCDAEPEIELEDDPRDKIMLRLMSRQGTTS